MANEYAGKSKKFGYRYTNLREKLFPDLLTVK
jgi:hypothetical protein